MIHLLNYFIALSSIILTIQAEYILIDDYNAENFADKFDFLSRDKDTYSNFLTRDAAQEQGLFKVENNKVYIGADYKKNVTNIRGRDTVRLQSKATYTHGLFILDLDHMPENVCGVWQAVHLINKHNREFENGDIKFIEGVNNQDFNTLTVHTTEGCSIDERAGQEGRFRTSNCFWNAPGQYKYQGCGVEGGLYGKNFNDANGGIYALKWDNEMVLIWFFKHDNVPDDIKNGKPSPGSNWGQPLANFRGGQDKCLFDKFINQQQINFDLSFCGSWPNAVWQYQCQEKAASCNDYVRSNPDAFKNVYWLINSLKVYHKSGNKQPIKCSNNKFLSSTSSNELQCQSDEANEKEHFEFFSFNNKYALIDFNNNFCYLTDEGKLKCGQNDRKFEEQLFELSYDDKRLVSFKCFDGKHLSLDNENLFVSCKEGDVGETEKFNISQF